jgi:hypothetical protein
LLAWFVPSPPVLAVAPETAQEHIARFLTHLDANRPILGTFTLTTEADGTETEQLRQKAEITSRLQPRVAIPKPVERLTCRWFISDRTEYMMSIPGAGTPKNDLFIDDEVAIMRMSPNAFVLDKPNPLPVWRPATFYFLHSQLPWRDALRNADLTIVDDGDAGQGGVVSVMARKKADRMAIKLTFDAQLGYLKSATTTFKDKPLFDLVIEDVAKSADHRLFPKRAVFQVYSISSPSKVDRRLTLEATSISFPTPESASREANGFVVPSGSIVEDKALGKFYHTTRPSTVSELKRGDLKSIAITDRGQPREEPVGLPVVRSKSWIAIVTTGAAIAALVVGILIIRDRWQQR